MNHRKYGFALLAAALLAGVWMRLDLVLTRPLISYDPHESLCEAIRQQYAARPAIGADRSGWVGYGRFMALDPDPHHMRWHPPAYHMLCAALGAGGSDMSSVLKAVSLACNIAVLLLVLLLLKHLFPGEPLLVLMGLGSVLFLPGHVVFSDLANNDVLLAALCALFLLLTLRREVMDHGRAGFAVLCLLCGLMLLVKYTGLVCFLYFNILLLAAAARGKITAGGYFRYTACLWLVCAAVAGWFYLDNYLIYGNPFFIPGITDIRHHSFVTFDLAGLLRGGESCRRNSTSVLTGFYASFYSFPYAPGGLFNARNIVLSLNLPLLAVAVAGIFSRRHGFGRLALFLALSLLASVALLWHYDTEHGPLKCNYLMFLAPVLAACFAEGLRLLREWKKGLFAAAVALALISNLAVLKSYGHWEVPSPVGTSMPGPAGPDSTRDRN